MSDEFEALPGGLREGGYGRDGTEYVYILELENGKYYVGWSPHIDRRIWQHFNGAGSKITKKHKPTRVVLVREGTHETEQKIVDLMAKHFGPSRVRGGNRSFPFEI